MIKETSKKPTWTNPFDSKWLENWCVSLYLINFHDSRHIYCSACNIDYHSGLALTILPYNNYIMVLSHYCGTHVLGILHDSLPFLPIHIMTLILRFDVII